MTFVESIQQQVNPATGQPISNFSTISEGPDQGLSALTIPINMQVQATRPTGASVNMFRTVQVALIPVFQFGVFSDSDLSYFAGPPFTFAGRIHTNGNLFLAANTGPLTTSSKITAFREIIRDRLANNYNGGGYNGSVYVPNQSNGCAGGGPAAHCIDLGPDSNNGQNDATWSGGIPPAGAQNANWASGANYANQFNSFVENWTQGVKQLVLPFVQGNNAANQGNAAQQIQIIRQGLATDNITLKDSKLYNKAAIRIFLADTQALLHADGTPTSGNGLLGNGNDIDLTGGGAQNGLQVTVNGTGKTRVAMAHIGSDPNRPPDNWAGGQPTGTAAYGNGNWNLVNGWLRVEYQDNAGGWHGITNEWLGYGFARGMNVPVNPENGAAAGRNTVHPDAILVLQELNNANAATSPIVDVGAGTQSQYSWYPINFWDAREGLPRDFAGASLSPALSGTQCFANGIMNAVEIDVGNLNQWLRGTGPYGGGTGVNVNNSQNGYILYFSDRRGMIVNPNDPNGASVDGESGLEDVVNTSSGTGTPNQTLEPAQPGYNVSSNNLTYSAEDVDENGILDKWGAADVGLGFHVNTAIPLNPYQRVDCMNGGRQNIVTGARHVLKLVDGSIGNLPMIWTANPPTGGFTVASENPVYVQGNYNSDAVDTVFQAGQVDDARPHAAASIIADAVSLLSNNWTDLNSMTNLDWTNGTPVSGRVPTATYFRMAIAAGKSMNFPQPAGTGNDFGTDGGVHNFLRLLENWGGVGLNYRGSLVSLYYSEYATGTFKCCSDVYGAPNRDFYFDSDFQNPQNLPPGTPMLQDVNNLSERQDFTPQ